MTCACGGEIPAEASFCPSCGRREGGARPVIGCLARAIAWTLAACALRAAFAGGWLLRSADAAFLFVFGRSAGAAAESGVAVVVVVGYMAVIAEGLLGDRVPIFKGYLKLVGRLVAFLPRAALWGFRAIFLVVEGRSPVLPEGKPAKKEKKEAD